MKDLVISTQKKLADWKIKTKGKRFRFQNVQGYDTLKLIQSGINLDKKATTKLLEANIKNLPANETPNVNHTKIVDLKTSVAEKNNHGKKNLINKRGYWEIRYAKCYPLLLKIFEENQGYTDTNKLYELEAATEGELTKKQIYKWFWYRRKKLGIDKSMLPIGN